MTRAPAAIAARRVRRAAPRGAGLHTAGLSLVEVMIALVVFAIGVLGLAVLMPLGTRKITTAGQQTRGSELASQCAEQILTTPYSDADLDIGVHNDPSNPYYSNYYVQWTVADSLPLPGCKRTTIEVHHPTLASPVVARLTVVTPQSGG